MHNMRTTPVKLEVVIAPRVDPKVPIPLLTPLLMYLADLPVAVDRLRTTRTEVFFLRSVSSPVYSGATHMNG